MIRSISLKTKYIDVQKIIGRSWCYFRFCNRSQKIYKPMVPLTQRYNTLYIHPKFAQLKYPRPKPYFVYILPAIAMFVNNYLTQWSFWSSLAFGLLFLGGSIAYQNFRFLQNFTASCIQVDPQLKYIIVTAGKSQFCRLLMEQYILQKSQLKSVTKYYHPFQQKYPESKYSYDVMKFRKNKANQQYQLKYVFMRLRLQRNIIRFKIPIQQLTFRPKITPAQLPEFQRDMERLSDKQLLRKYENHDIIIYFKYRTKQKQFMHFNVETDLNKFKRYHDYLLALALNYRIDTSANAVFNEPEIQIDDPQQNQQTENSNQKQNKIEEGKNNTKKGDKNQNNKQN